ncbi:MAG TPA: serine hydrolase [Coleofasciculaceae cyanobacterium]
MPVKARWILPSLIGVALLSSPAQAGNLESWNFNPNLRQLDLITDEGVQPKVFLIENPTRLVIDLPGIIKGRSQTQARKEPLIQEIRVGQVDTKTTRMVVEVASGYTLDPKKVKVRADSPTRWSIQLPTPERVREDNNSSQALQAIEVPPAPPVKFAGILPLGQEMSGLEPQVKALMAKYKFLTPGMFFLDLDTGDYLDISGDRVFPAASTIKLPILIAFFQDLDAGKVSLNETLTMRRNLVARGSGTMQYKKPGTKFSVRETVTMMSTISDNTATNMIIDRLGGIAKLNQRFRSWGLQDTVIRNMLGDFKGTNTTSSKDMVRLLALLENGKLLSPSSEKQALEILRKTKTKTLLPAGLGSGASIAHKTGDIGFLIGDAGYIEMPNGKRYLAGIYVRRPYNDLRGRAFIRQVSATVYNYLQKQPTGVAATSPTR